MASKKRVLKWDDMGSHDDLINERLNYSDEQAQKLGYPSAIVLRLSDKLTRIAGEWRETKQDTLVVDYRQTLYEMILKGYDLDTLPIQDQLPTEFMPELPPPRVRSAIVEAYRELVTD